MDKPRDEAANRLLTDLMRATMPGLRTQAQYDGFLVAFDALRMTVNGTFERDKKRAADGRAALDKALQALEGITDLSEKLREVPEAATSAAAEAFKRAPVQFGEEEKMRALLDGLACVSSRGELNGWYTANRALIDDVATESMRAKLFDAIRERKLALP